MVISPSFKSTLVKLCVGALQPLSGVAKISPQCKIEYLAQHQLEQLDPDGTPLSTMIDRYPSDRSNTHIGELRRYLANFGLGGTVLPVQKIHTMSGGQKCRLCLACAMYRKPHLLVLDEPYVVIVVALVGVLDKLWLLSSQFGKTKWVNHIVKFSER